MALEHTAGGLLRLRPLSENKPHLAREDLSSSCCLATPSSLVFSNCPSSLRLTRASPALTRERPGTRKQHFLSFRGASPQEAWSTSTPVTTQASKRSIPLALPMSRRLILLRHAKSSWDDPSLKDHERPLAPRGRKAAKRIAAKLLDEGWIPELILCSDSTRTRQTLAHMCNSVPAFEEIPVKFLASYYSVAAMDGQTAIHLQETVVKYAGLGIGTVMCMGHNRGWEEAASEFADETIELKTAHGALLESVGEHSDWATAFADGGWKLHGIVTPGMTQDS